jgi:hypothetical protein
MVHESLTKNRMKLPAMGGVPWPCDRNKSIAEFSMAVILDFRLPIDRKPAAARRKLPKRAGPAQILFFNGVRYSRSGELPSCPPASPTSRLTQQREA